MAAVRVRSGKAQQSRTLPRRRGFRAARHCPRIWRPLFLTSFFIRSRHYNVEHEGSLIQLQF